MKATQRYAAGCLTIALVVVTTVVWWSTKRQSIHDIVRGATYDDIREALSAGVNVNEVQSTSSDWRDGDMTPLMLVGTRTERQFNNAIVRDLLRFGARIDAVDRAGRSALHHAVKNRDIDSAVELLRAGADPFREDSAGQSALALAIENDWLAFIIVSHCTHTAHNDQRDLEKWRSLEHLADKIYANQDLSKYISTNIVKAQAAPGTTGGP